MWVGFFVVRGISDREIGSRGEGYARLDPGGSQWNSTVLVRQWLSNTCVNST